MIKNGLRVGDSDLFVTSGGTTVKNLTVGNVSIPSTIGSDNQILKVVSGSLAFANAADMVDSDLTVVANLTNKVNDLISRADSDQGKLDGINSITLGSANELLVVGSDGASIISNSTLGVDTGNNRLGINQTSPEVTLHMTGEGAQSAQIRMEQHNDSADAPDIRTRKSRGTADSSTKNNAGDFIYRSNHERYNGSAYTTVGQFAVDTNSSNADRFQLTLSVSENGNTVDAAQAQFKIDGNDSGAITFNGAYKFPTSDGSANQVLQTDGSGTLTFVNQAGMEDSDLTKVANLQNKVDGLINRLDSDDADRQIGTLVVDSDGQILLNTNDDVANSGTLTIDSDGDILFLTGNDTLDSVGNAILSLRADRDSDSIKISKISEITNRLDSDSAAIQSLATKTRADLDSDSIIIQQLKTATNTNTANIAGLGGIDSDHTFQTLTVNNTTTDDSILVTTTEDSNNAGPVITLKRNSSSVADADYLGQIKFKGENDADQEIVYAKITAKIQDASDGTEDGIIEIAHKKAGSNNISARFNSDTLQLINGTGLEISGDFVTNTSGTSNFVAGTNAGNSIESGGNYNVAVGDEAGTALTTGVNNTHVGYRAGDASTTGNSNIAIGKDALGSDTTGSNNIAIGENALLTQNFTGGTNSYNIGIGSDAGKDITDGQRNIIIGGLAGDAITDADDVIAIGYRACGGNAGSATTGHDNTVIGSDAAREMLGGSANTVLGRKAGESLNSGNNNTLIGMRVADGTYGTALTTGAGNSFIGYQVGANAADTSYSIVVGYNSVSKGSSTGFISPNDGAVYQGNNSSSWSTTSDERLKKNITDSTVGLTEINQLQIRNFEYRTASELDSEDNLKATDLINKSGVQVGVIAQEIQTVLPNTVSTESTGVLSVNPDNLTWHLVKAVQELSAKVTALETENATQATQIADLISRVTALESE